VKGYCLIADFFFTFLVLVSRFCFLYYCVQKSNLFGFLSKKKSWHRILNKLTPEKFDLLKGQLIEAGITTADILKVCLFLFLYSAGFIVISSL
jgi:hypothetical protein